MAMLVYRRVATSPNMHQDPSIQNPQNPSFSIAEYAETPTLHDTSAHMSGLLTHHSSRAAIHLLSTICQHTFQSLLNNTTLRLNCRTAQRSIKCWLNSNRDAMPCHQGSHSITHHVVTVYPMATPSDNINATWHHYNGKSITTSPCCICR